MPLTILAQYCRARTANWLLLSVQDPGVVSPVFKHTVYPVVGFRSQVVTTCNNKMSMFCLDIKSSKIRSRLSGLLFSISHLTPLVRRSLWHRLHLRFCMNRNCRPGYSHVTRGQASVSVLPNMETRHHPWHSPFTSPSPSSTR